jgi:hypothetical protein
VVFKWGNAGGKALADTVRRGADQEFFRLLFLGEKRDVREIAGSNETNGNKKQIYDQIY